MKKGEGLERATFWESMFGAIVIKRYILKKANLLMKVLKNFDG